MGGDWSLQPLKHIDVFRGEASTVVLSEGERAVYHCL